MSVRTPATRGKTRRVGFVVGPKVVRLIDALTATGLWGRTRAATARDLMLRSLREAALPRG